MLAVTMDQVAFCARTDEDEVAIKKILQLEGSEWKEDIATAEGMVGAEHGRNTAKLLFNYDLEHEVEILRYLNGPNYLDLAEVPSRHLCHIGMHHVIGNAVPRIDRPIIQQVTTIQHTNPYLMHNGRHYRYTIYDTLNSMGVFLKIIERIQ